MSLRRITLRNFVIVKELDLDLSQGFSVMTGETGAGKSILIDALQLALGARADTSVIREGAIRSEVSVEFDMTPALSEWLQEAGFDEADHLLLRRTIDLQGKSRAWINGSSATATQLKELGEQLVDIHGQHAWQSLTRGESVRQLLDAYAGIHIRPLQQLWQHWRASLKSLDDARARQDNLQSERERLEWQLGEVAKLSVTEAAWQELNTEHSRLSHGQALLDAARAALEALQDEDSGALIRLARATSALQEQGHLEPGFVQLSDILASSLAQAEDAAHSLQGYLRKTDLDPQRLLELDSVMAQWLSASRRYKRAPAELPLLVQGWKAELARLDQLSDLEQLRLAEEKARVAFCSEAAVVSSLRSKAAAQLAHAITRAMQGLGMQGGQFEVALQPLETATSTGSEEVVFLVAAHQGSAPKPVAKVASGGELSRIALAIAVTTSQLGTAQTLIFDEVDSGVGGAVAQTVGRLMKKLGKDRQVLAVTHLPQVAACADHHLLVAKHSHAGQTLSEVVPVAGEGRVAEVARMLGGEHLSETTLAHAREMLDLRVI